MVVLGDDEILGRIFDLVFRRLDQCAAFVLGLLAEGARPAFDLLLARCPSVPWLPPRRADV